MKRITTLNIFGLRYAVRLAKLDPQIAGLFDREKLSISINSDVAKNQDLLLETIFHELFHGIFERLSVKQAGFPPELEEVIIDQISKILVENRKNLKKLM